MKCFIISGQKAAALRTATAPGGVLAERGHIIDPRQIMAGEHAGKWAVPTRCVSDKAFERLKDRFANLVIADLVIDEAWPPEPEPDA